MLSIYVNIFLGVIITLSLVVLWFVLPPDSPWTPWWRINSKKSVIAGKLAKISPKDLVYELGSGDANFLVGVCREYGARGFGIEFDYLRHLMGWLNVIKNGLSKKIILKQGNFFDHNISKANVVFVYLVPRVLDKLKPKFNKELRKGARIVSYVYKFEIQPKDKIRYIKSDNKNKIHLYEIK